MQTHIKLKIKIGSKICDAQIHASAVLSQGTTYGVRVYQFNNIIYPIFLLSQ
jgi:hypothetical protein